MKQRHQGGPHEQRQRCYCSLAWSMTGTKDQEAGLTEKPAAQEQAVPPVFSGGATALRGSCSPLTCYFHPSYVFYNLCGYKVGGCALRSQTSNRPKGGFALDTQDLSLQVSTLQTSRNMGTSCDMTQEDLRKPVRLGTRKFLCLQVRNRSGRWGG